MEESKKGNRKYNIIKAEKNNNKLLRGHITELINHIPTCY